MAQVERGTFLALLQKSISDLNLKNCAINVVENSKHCGGYNGEMIFVDILGKDSKYHNLLVKKAIPDENIRQNVPIRQSYLTEIFIYQVAWKIFEQFQQPKLGKSYLSVPRCFGSNSDDTEELLILENLKPKGYQIHDSSKPMNLQHLKLVLAEYAKLHALSFALRHQQPAQFAKLTKEKFKAVGEFITSPSLVAELQRSFRNVSNVLKLAGRSDLLQKFEMLDDNFRAKMIEIFNVGESQSVLVHGDCWNNNFLFKYEADDRDNPVAICLIDFQLSNILSPVFDLSFFLFTSCSKHEYRHFDVLLHWYYSSFASFLIRLGSVPDELFSFDDLLVHWQKYSIMGFMIAPLSLKFIFNDNEALSLDELTSHEDGFIIKSKLDAYNRRLLEVTEQYFNVLDGLRVDKCTN